ncbi:MAG: hypothetical protein Q8O25_02000 [Sulfurisoma sp.]|nr:hypothetical protein [Sulfurisoma sp.]
MQIIPTIGDIARDVGRDIEGGFHSDDLEGNLYTICQHQIRTHHATVRSPVGKKWGTQVWILQFCASNNFASARYLIYFQ